MIWFSDQSTCEVLDMKDERKPLAVIALMSETGTRRALDGVSLDAMLAADFDNLAGEQPDVLKMVSLRDIVAHYLKTHPEFADGG